MGAMMNLAQAAAHGVPTVATRNGGPVDIMKTLHHGVTVDPTDEVAVAEALLNILTNRATWDTMSKNGAHLLNILYLFIYMYYPKESVHEALSDSFFCGGIWLIFQK